MSFKNILICMFLFLAGAIAGKKTYQWRQAQGKEMRVPPLQQEFLNVAASPEREVYLFLHTKNQSQAICRSLSTLARQEYTALHLYLLDENSTDDTWEKANRYIEENKVFVEKKMRGNRKELLQFVNEVLAKAPENSLVVPLEGKNWLPHAKVIQLMNHQIHKENCRLFLGQHSTYPEYKLGIAKRWIKKKVSKHKWPKSASFLSVFKAFEVSLFQEVPNVDIFALHRRKSFQPLYWQAQRKVFFSPSVYYVENRLEPGKKLLFSEGE